MFVSDERRPSPDTQSALKICGFSGPSRHPTAPLSASSHGHSQVDGVKSQRHHNNVHHSLTPAHPLASRTRVLPPSSSLHQQQHQQQVRSSPHTVTSQPQPSPSRVSGAFALSTAASSARHDSRHTCSAAPSVPGRQDVYPAGGDSWRGAKPLSPYDHAFLHR